MYIASPGVLAALGVLLALAVLTVGALVVLRLSGRAPLAIAAVLLSLATLVGTLPALIQSTRADQTASRHDSARLAIP